MASAKLTAERKEQLKNYILEEIEKNDSGGVKKSKNNKKSRATNKANKSAKTESKPTLAGRKPAKSAPVVEAKPAKSEIKIIAAANFRPTKPPQNNQTATNNKQEKKRRSGGLAGVLVRLLVFVILTLLLLLVVDIFGIYRLGWTDDFSYRVAYLLRLPAGQADGMTIAAADYIDDVQTVKSALITNREGFDSEILQDTNDIQDKIFNRLAMIAIINKELEKNGRSVSGQELDQEMSNIIEEAGGVEAAQNITQELYKMSLEDFKYKVLKPLMAKDALQEIIVEDESLDINKQAKERATEALKLALDKTVNFATLAEQYTEDEAGINTGGDLGWISSGELSSEMESIVLELDKGEIYPELIKNRFGYHLVKATDKTIDVDTGRTSVKVSHILIKVDVNEYIKQLMDGLKIKNYLKSN